MGSASEPRKVFTYMCVCVYTYMLIYTLHLLKEHRETSVPLDYTLTGLGPENTLALKPFESTNGLVIEVFPSHHSGRMGE